MAPDWLAAAVIKLLLNGFVLSKLSLELVWNLLAAFLILLHHIALPLFNRVLVDHEDHHIHKILLIGASQL